VHGDHTGGNENFGKAGATIVARPMLKQRSGRIVNVTSVIGLIGNAGQANYAASKGGLVSLTLSTAKEFAARNVTVNAVAPGFIETEMTGALKDEVKRSIVKGIPVGRFGKADDVAAAVRFLVGSGAAYITGQVVVVDGGMSLGPVFGEA
jgi:3-oxoacyl-[acyl-carrier protein] reductase